MTEKEAAYYANIVNCYGSSGSRVLVLGATPALRIMAHKAGAQVFCADFSVPMLKHMGKYVDAAIPGAVKKETWFRGDWCDISYPQNFFNLILGDNIFLFLRRERRAAFLRVLKGALVREGYFVTRTHVLEGSRRTYNEYLQSFFKEDIVKAKNKRQTILRSLNVGLLDASWDRLIGATRRTDAVAAVRAYRSCCGDVVQQEILKDFLREYENGIDFYFEERNRLENELREAFLLRDVYEADDHGLPGAVGYPLYVFQNS